MFESDENLNGGAGVEKGLGLWNYFCMLLLLLVLKIAVNSEYLIGITPSLVGRIIDVCLIQSRWL